jgi:hypothetical protein
MRMSRPLRAQIGMPQFMLMYVDAYGVVSDLRVSSRVLCQ